MKTNDATWALGNSMPGWGIVADLTPPELVAGRKLRVIRRVMAGVVALTLLLCMSAYGYATWQVGDAENQLANEQLQRTLLIKQQREYSAVTTVRGDIQHVKEQVAGLMAGDVTLDVLINSVVQALPASMTIEQMSVTVTPKDAAAGKAATVDRKSGGIGSLDLSDSTHIGSITLSGAGAKLTDLAAYVAALQKVPGVFEPYPLSNQATDSGTAYSLQLTLTDALLTHRFDTDGGTP